MDLFLMYAKEVFLFGYLNLVLSLSLPTHPCHGMAADSNMDSF